MSQKDVGERFPVVSMDSREMWADELSLTEKFGELGKPVANVEWDDRVACSEIGKN